MKCLVTGGAGFIGSFLCDRLLETGHEVVCIDNLVTGHKKNIAHLLSQPKFEFIEHDVTLPLPEAISASVIFHFASPASPPKYQKYAIETLLVNSIGTYYLLEKARVWQAKFIFASTSEVYGDPREHPQKETYWGHVNPNGPRSCYDEAKRVGESFVATYIRKYQLDGRIIRIFNTFGPRMDIDDGRVVTNFIKQILSRTPLTIQGDGSQTRSFCYISDLIEGIMSVFTTPAARGEVINLGNPEEKTILELLNIIKKVSHYWGETVFLPLPEDDPLRRKPDITKAQNLLHWEAKVGLEEGLTKTLEYFKK